MLDPHVRTSCSQCCSQVSFTKITNNHKYRELTISSIGKFWLKQPNNPCTQTPRSRLRQNYLGLKKNQTHTHTIEVIMQLHNKQVSVLPLSHIIRSSSQGNNQNKNTYTSSHIRLICNRRKISLTQKMTT